MKILAFTSLFLLSMFMIGSCADESKPEEKKQNPPLENGFGTYVPIKGKKIAALFLCDFTTSLDTAGWSTIIDNQLKCAEQLPDGSMLTIYGIDATAYNSTIFQGELPMPTGELKAHLSKYKKQKKEFIDRLQLALGAARTRALHADKNKQSISCITVSLSKAKAILANTNNTAYNPALFIFSDMVEQCDQTAGKINFCTVPFATTNSLLNKNYRPDFQLKAIVGNRIYFVVTPDNLKCELKDSDLRSLWQTILSKHGYTLSESQAMHFDSSIPVMK